MPAFSWSDRDAWAITLDLDWAPDFVIDFVAGKLLERQVPATWMVTHGSPAVDRLRRHPQLFELGIHPNFLPGSTHGDQPAAVLRHCLHLVPAATSLRTHSLVQSTPLLAQVLAQTAITADVSLFLPHTPHLQPVNYRWGGKTLVRIPFFWEDDFEMEGAQPGWQLEPGWPLSPGLKVFNFHPIHIYLNSPDLRAYQRIKKHPLQDLTAAEAADQIEPGRGTRSFFLELVDYLAEKNPARRVCDLDASWRAHLGL